MQQPQLFTEVVDVGYSDQPLESVRVHLLCGDGRSPFPSEALIRQGSRVPGEFGFMDKESAEWPGFYELVTRRLSELVEDDTLIVLPEFAGSEELTAFTSGLLRDRGRRCCVVAGTYYRWKEGQAQGEIQSVCPVILPDGQVWEQVKFQASPHEEGNGYQGREQGVLRIFQNTGFGDFAVLVCYDAHPDHCTAAVAALRGRIDILVVVARNRDSAIPSHQRNLSTNERWVIPYCEGLTDDSAVYTPLHGKRMVKDAQVGVRVDIKRLHRAMVRQPERFARLTQTERFTPQPRHFFTSARSGVGLRRHAKVLAIGSHFDDIWLGCSATLMLLQETYGAEVVCTSLCSHYPEFYFGQYLLDDRALDDFCEHLCKSLGFRWVKSGPSDPHLSDREFAEKRENLRTRVKSLRERYQDAELVFVPRRDDAHDDHVLTAKTVLSQFKRSTILEYEVKEFRRVPFQPSLIVDVSRRSQRPLTVQIKPLRGRDPAEVPIFDPDDDSSPAASSFARKKALILKTGFGTFLGGELPSTFEEEHSLGRMRVRASESSGEPRFAEAFATEVLIP